ncbi:hypothetical protein L2E82_11426 [Cichorium intybus]|uniref:Uncharacterized protein n=1 Tax=Cichorium intybus TaxID=13427 RepID=A0ACB9GDF9_CICIN|nr:hypothetical protein L2E82_11426 [Cichorium intybus]
MRARMSDEGVVLEKGGRVVDLGVEGTDEDATVEEKLSEDAALTESIEQNINPGSSECHHLNTLRSRDYTSSSLTYASRGSSYASRGSSYTSRSMNI